MPAQPTGFPRKKFRQQLQNQGLTEAQIDKQEKEVFGSVSPKKKEKAPAKPKNPPKKKE
jgi:hypothetical protein